MASISNDIDEALNRLLRGELVAIPTETVYGLAADASSDKAIEAIYALKKRPFDKPLALNIHPNWPLGDWALSDSDLAKKLIETFWPGPLTIVLPAQKDKISKYVLGPNDTVAFRCPNHPLTLQLLKKLKRPLVAPSANPSEQFSPVTAFDVKNYFDEAELLILDSNHPLLGIESTIVQIIDDATYEILRFGAVTNQSLEACIGFPPKKEPYFEDKSTALKIPMYYFEDIETLTAHLKLRHQPCNYLCIGEESILNRLNPEKRLIYSMMDLEKSFYSLMRQAQTFKTDVIFIQLPNNSHHAIKERILSYAKPLKNHGIL